MITPAGRRAFLLILSSLAGGVLVCAAAPTGALGSSPPVTGQVLSFGSDSGGQLGQGGAVDPNAHPTPTLVALPAGGPAIVATAEGAQFSLLVDSNGALYSVGANDQGQLGTGSSSSTSVTTPAVVSLPGVDGKVTAIAAGTYSALAVTASGQLFGWGNNSDGQVGSSTGGAPHLIALPKGAGSAVAVAAGQFQSLVATSTGAVYSFGDNGCGELGYATAKANPNPTPTQVPLPSGTFAIGVASGQQSSYVTTRGGTVYSFGFNDDGQLGRAPGSNTCESTPGVYALPSGVHGLQAAAGNSFAVVLADDGSVYSSGDNGEGQLGVDSAGSQFSTPTAAHLPTGLGAPVSVAATDYTSYILLSSGSLASSGEGTLGELGDTTTTTAQRKPTLVAPPAGSTFESIGTGEGASHELATVSNLAAATTTLPSGQQGSSYAATLAATGGVAPYFFAATGLPNGLTVNTTGDLSGKPTEPGSFTVNATVIDANGITAATTIPLTIAADPNAPAPAPPVTAPPIVTPPVVTPPVVTPPVVTPVSPVLPITVTAPSSSAITKALLASLVPSGKGATFAVLSKKGYSQAVSILAPGKLSVAWTYKPAGKHAKTVTIATGAATFTKAGLSHLTVKLTKAGAALLKPGRKLPITFTATYGRVGQSNVIASRKGILA